MTDADSILEVLRATRFNYIDEDSLQQGIAAALAAASIPYLREARLEGAGRIDFLAGDVGIETKVAGAVGDVSRQIRRYCAHTRIGTLILVTDRVRHLTVRDRTLGKPVHVVSIARQGL